MLSIFDRGPASPCPSPFNLAAYVLNHSDADPSHPCLEVLHADHAEIWTRQAFSSSVQGLAAGLRKQGFKPGDILLMRLGNTVDFPITFLAAIWAGLIPVPTSAQLSETEVAAIIADLSPAAVLRDPEVSSAHHDREIRVDQLRDWQNTPAMPAHMTAPDTMAYVVYTSGTSGRPRAVAHAHRAIWARRMMIRDWYDLHATDRLLHAGAFNWTFTLGSGLMDPMSMGATALIPAAGLSPDHLPQLLRQHKATIFAAVPGVYRRILKQVEPLDLPDLRHGISAGEKLSAGIHADWQARTGCDIYEAFGMSECSTFISAAPHRPATGAELGQPQTGRRVAILGEAGPVPLGQPGVLAVHRDDPGLMLGYLHAPEATRDKMQGPWFLTGDLARMDENGQITYLGRNDDMMNAGGYRVSPLEVEAAMAPCPGLGQFAVAAVEVKADVQIIVGFFTGRADVTEDQLAAFAADRLAAYKCPKSYQRVTALPLGPNGKLQRRALPALFKGHTE